MNKIKLKFREGTIGQSVGVLTRAEKIKIIGVICIQILMSLMDLLGVVVVGILGSLAVRGIQSQRPGTTVETVLTYLHIESLTLQMQALSLGVLATILFIARTFLSIIFTRKTMFFLSRRAAVISTLLFAKVLRLPLLTLQKRSTQELLYSVTTGVGTITLGIIGGLVQLIADMSLIIVMSLSLVLVDPILAIATAMVFSIIARLLYKLMHKKVSILGERSSYLTINSSEKILEVLTSFRELVVRNRREYYVEEVRKTRFDLSDTVAELSFIPSISKYVFEGAVIIGALTLGAVQFASKDAVNAIGTIAIFLAAGSRIAPAILRVQQSAVSIKGSLGVAKPTLLLIAELRDIAGFSGEFAPLDILHKGFRAEVKVSNVEITYPEKSTPAIKNISLTIPQGSMTAFVGSSGAGKTTLVDTILGVLIPDTGEVTISGLSPAEAIVKWPGAIAYVPQDILVINGSIRENVGLGFPKHELKDDLIEHALEIASLLDFVSRLPNGLDTQVGERGAKLSGGQRQRLGIARALFTKPNLLILDEATSALDGTTEREISNAINKLKGHTTILVIAHRLSTVRDSDKVFYLENGIILAEGLFEEIRNKIPQFDEQAKLMGL
jgi:ABC-type multidrug transport system fused ATPase/permease subunit